MVRAKFRHNLPPELKGSAVSNIAGTAVCSATSTTLTITAGYVSSQLAAGSTVSFSVSQIDNPVSTQPSSTFQISTFSSSGYNIDTKTSGIIVTMTSVNSFNTISLALDSLINGAITNLEFTIAASSPIKDGDVLIVTFPSQVKAPSGTVTWTGTLVLSNSLTWTKTSSSPETIKLIINLDATTSISANELFKFKILSITNPSTTEPTSTFGFQLQNTNGYNINSFSGSVTMSTSVAAELLNPTISPSNTIASSAITIVFGFKIANDFPSTGVIYLYYPSQVTFTSSSLSCQCIVSGALASTSTCTWAQQTVGSDNRIIIRNSFTSGTSSGTTVQLTINGFSNPSTSDVTSSFKIYTYTAETSGYKIDQKESGLTLQSQWDYPCLTWGTTKTSWNSWITSVSFPYKLQGNSWVLNWDSNKFYNTTTNAWENWDSTCAAWSTTSKTIWTKWGLTGYEYLYSGTWIHTWPATYFGNLATFTWNNCDSTSAHCKNWVNTSTYWTSWDTTSSYKYLQGSSWLSSWTANTYIQDNSAYTCTPWDTNWKTWTSSTTQCTSWNGSMKLDLRTNSWVNNWETGKTIDTGTTWVGWDSNWLTCGGTTTTWTAWTSGKVLTAANVWSGTWTNSNEISVSGVCTKWDSTWTTCKDSITYWTAWADGFALYQNQWISHWPLKYENKSKVWVYVGLVWPTNYEPNSNQDSWVPIQKTCTGDKVLNSDQTQCIPKPGNVVPFPFLFVALWFILLVIAGKIKDKQRNKIIGNLIPLLGLIETPWLLILAITAAFVEGWIIFSIALFAYFVSISLNILMYILFKRFTIPDSDFWYYAKRYPKTAATLPFLWLIWNFRILKFFYSGFFGLDTWMLVLSNSEQIFMKYFRRVIISSFVFVHIPAYIAWGVGFATLIWGYQALVESIEIPIILLTIFVLTIIERKIESSHLRGDTYLPLNGMKKYVDDIAVMSALPLHRSLTKEKDEESKTENYSISYDADRQSQKELEYDVELRKKALMSIVNHIK